MFLLRIIPGYFHVVLLHLNLFHLNFCSTKRPSAANARMAFFNVFGWRRFIKSAGAVQFVSGVLRRWNGYKCGWYWCLCALASWPDAPTPAEFCKNNGQTDAADCAETPCIPQHLPSCIRLSFLPRYCCDSAACLCVSQTHFPAPSPDSGNIAAT